MEAPHVSCLLGQRLAAASVDWAKADSVPWYWNSDLHRIPPTSIAGCVDVGLTAATPKHKEWRSRQLRKSFGRVRAAPGCFQWWSIKALIAVCAAA